MVFLHIFFTSVGSVIALFLLTKFMGNRQMSELNMFDYINSITIGSIAAEMATSLKSDFLKPLLAMVVYTAFSVGVSVITRHSLAWRRRLNGETIVLLDKGKINEKNLKKAKLDLSEFLTQCRSNGYFNINNLESVFLEDTGRMSFLPKAEQRPLTPQDMNLSPPKERPVINIILDGQILFDNLSYTGNNETWLDKALHAQGYAHVTDVLLATCDNQNNLSVYPKTHTPQTRDIFE